MNQDELLANLANDYYLNKLNFAELADKYHLSRYLVNKYLEEARQQGVVTFTIQSPENRNWSLERKFKRLFPIKNIYIIKDSNDSAQNMSSITNYAAQKIEENVKHCHVIGTAWGSTTYNIISKFSQLELEDLVCVQFIGENMKYNSAVGSMRMVEQVAKKFSSSYLTLSGPLYITNNATREGMMQEVATKEAIKAAQRMEMLFTGIGTLDSVKSIPNWWRNVDQIFPNVNLSAIAGFAYGRPYDIYGNFLNQDNDKTFGLNLETILQTPVRFAVVESKFKTAALIGALRGNLFSDIITSEAVANRILSDNHKI